MRQFQSSLKFIVGMSVPLLAFSVPASAVDSFASGTYATQWNTLGYFGSATSDFNEAIIFNADGSVTTAINSSSPDYDGSDDAAVIVVNNSGSAVSSLALSNPGVDILAFDGDGIDAYTTAGAGSNVLDSSGYGGTNAYFSGISAGYDAGTVNFVKSIASGSYSYFSLEEQASATTTVAPPAGGSSGGGGVASAPEIDPASATSGMSLLFGALAVLRSRKRRA